MKDQQSFLMFITGVTGRAMGSGRDPQDLDAVVAAAIAAWGAHIEPRISEAPAPQPCSGGFPGRPASRPAGGGYGGPKKSFEISEATWDSWKEDKLRLGKKISPLGKTYGDCTWAEVASFLRDDDPEAVGHVEWLCNKLDPNDPKYGDSNRKHAAKARIALKLFGKVPGNMEEDPVATPF